MAESGSYSPGFQLDIKQILLEAQDRWLRPVEICEILRNYQKFHISPEAPNNPVSGSIFLFDRKVLRYFRKDGHNWRKKKDGKTVKEAHEKLKVGSIDMLHCYYAHGEDNENFQRRSYWLLEQKLMHIVFVHYLEVKGGKASISCVRNSDMVLSNSENDSSLSSSFHGASPTSTLSSVYEDAESEDKHQASSRCASYPESPLTDDSHSALSNSHNLLSCPGNQNITSLNYASLPWRQRDGDSGGGSFISGTEAIPNLASWREGLGNSTTGNKQESGCHLPLHANLQHNFGDHSLHFHIPTMDQNLMLNLPHDHESKLFEEKSLLRYPENDMEPFYSCPDDQKEQSEQVNLQNVLSVMEIRNAANPNLENGANTIGSENYSFFPRKPLISCLQMNESLKKVDSFSRWMDKEIGEADELNMQSSDGLSWSIMGNEYDSNMSAQLEVDADTMSPSISQDQLFSIADFIPNWAYSNLDTKVLIIGTFLKSEQELSKCRWSLMLGEVEVPAEVLADGILCSHAPPHKPGLIPFYVTCSNRLACSEIREFEYRCGPGQNIGSDDVNGDGVIVMHLYQRFEMLLCLGAIGSHVSSFENDFEKQNIVKEVVSLMEENNQNSKVTSKNDTSELKVIGEMLLEKRLKEKFYSWLLHKIKEEGKGPLVLDEGGQGVIHLAAALGFNWALQPITVSGVSIDFRDVNGWTALHWAAVFGREDTVAALVSLGAAPGTLTDPSAEYPLGRTPADLASSRGQKGISGFLAEISLTMHLSTLSVDAQQEDGASEVAGVKAIHAVSDHLGVHTTEEVVLDTLSLKDSLAAICNATQAAARIHQIFRVQSFQRKKFMEQGCNELLTSDEHAISFVAAKTSRFGHCDGMANAAAVRIQKKFRGWKKRQEFLIIRQKVVKIQAHVRGHQVRKKHKSIVWSVGILEKVILRWRRKRSGLRGFRSDDVLERPNIHGTMPVEDDYDVLREGIRQTEERTKKALARVKSMAQYPEARAQYRRLLAAAEGFREAKGASDVIPDNKEDMIYPEEDLIDIKTLLDDDSFMSLTFQ